MEFFKNKQKKLGNKPCPTCNLNESDRTGLRRLSELQHRVDLYKSLLTHSKLKLAKAVTGKHKAYSERNKLVIAYAKLATDLGWNVGLSLHKGEYENAFRTILYIDTPAGQVSWHFNYDELEMLSEFGIYEGKWDGHTVTEKYERLTNIK